MHSFAPMDTAYAFPFLKYPYRIMQLFSVHRKVILHPCIKVGVYGDSGVGKTIHFSIMSATLLSMPFFRDKIRENSSLAHASQLISAQFILVQHILVRSMKKAKTTYRNCNFLSASISDNVDWKVFRRRQLHTHLYPSIQQSLDEYFLLCSSRLCIFDGGRRRFRNLLFASWLMMTSVALYTLMIITGTVLMMI